VPVFMDFHPDLKLPAEAIAQIADDTRNERADQFGVQSWFSLAVRYSRAIRCPPAKLAEAVRNPLTICSGVQPAPGGCAMICGSGWLWPPGP